VPASQLPSLHTARRYTLTLACPDRVGIVAAVAGFLADHGGWIVESSNHSDAGSGWFFTRQVVLADSLPFDRAELEERFAPIAERFAMQWQVSDSAHPRRVLVLVSQQDHCLYDLLHRFRAADFPFTIPCVVSNHETLRGFVEWHGIPFFHVPVSAETSDQAHREVMRLYAAHDGEAMVLARYMRILPPWMCAALPGRILNIHHSFLPSFVGARPYHQAYERGVKLIGATCHYVSEELDAGPIIEQDVIRVDHGDSVEDMVRYGRDIERTVLARGLRYHCEDRVLLHGNKTIVFR
jgi:formyltetrahydrofolate deformylase